MITQAGFLGYGTYWLVAISTFIFAQSRRHLLYWSLAPAVMYIGMSVFVNYMDARVDIRKLVWFQHASLADRLDRVENILQNFEWLDLSNKKHLQAIDTRLNQNILVGAAVARLELGRTPYASGATISDMIVSLIPRAVWPDKPAVGGGGDVVTKYTGIRFERNTSVGAGQVLEFYVNFGTWAVIGGFLIYGLLLEGFMDVTIIESLHRGDQRRFLLWFMMAVSLLQPGGNLVHITVSAAAAATSAYGLNILLNRRRSASDLLLCLRCRAKRLFDSFHFIFLDRSAGGAVEKHAKLIASTYENNLRSLGDALRNRRPTAAGIRTMHDKIALFEGSPFLKTMNISRPTRTQWESFCHRRVMKNKSTER